MGLSSASRRTCSSLSSLRPISVPSSTRRSAWHRWTVPSTASLTRLHEKPFVFLLNAFSTSTGAPRAPSHEPKSRGTMDSYASPANLRSRHDYVHGQRVNIVVLSHDSDTSPCGTCWSHHFEELPSMCGKKT